MRLLSDLVAPILAVIGFYVVLGGVIWLLIEPTAARRIRQTSVPWPRSPIVQRTLLISLSLVIAGLSLTIVTASLVLQVIGAQLIVLALLVIILDRQAAWRTRYERREQVRLALKSPVAAVAAAAHHEASSNGWLHDGTFAFADLAHHDWSRAKLSGVDFHGSDLRHSTLRRATFREANLISANLDAADLRAADFSWADLRGATLRGVRGKGVTLSGTNLSNVDLTEAKLNNADLRGADLSRADLCGASLKGARLTGTRLGEAVYDRRTRWPKDTDPALLGARFIDGTK